MFVFLFVALCFSHSCSMFEKLDNIKSYLLCLSKSDEDTEARDDTTTTFVIKAKFGISFENTWVGFHTLYTKRILQL